MGKTEKIHEGRNIKRFREMLSIKQETMAFELGKDWTQKKISQLEAKESVEKEILEQVAKILHVTPEVIQKFNEASAVNFITRTFTDFKNNNSETSINSEINFNPLDKLMEALEENKKLREETIQLYERLLSCERKTAKNYYNGISSPETIIPMNYKPYFSNLSM